MKKNIDKNISTFFPRTRTQPYISPLYTIKFVHNIARILKGKKQKQL